MNARHHQHYTTAGLPPNHEFGYWRNIVDDAYFHLQLEFQNDQRFEARLDNWTLPLASLSRLQSSPLKYKRLRQHCQQLDHQVLVTIPIASEVEFVQLGRNLRCQPGQFLLEYSDEPYEFSYGHDNALWVLKLPEAMLQKRLGNASRYCARVYDADNGVAQLFREYVALLSRQCTQVSPTAMALMSAQAVDLLALALTENAGLATDTQNTTIVRAGHMARVEAYIRAHLFDPKLSPASVAAACGISLRYLHALFKDESQSVAESIRARRLQAAHEQLLSGRADSVVAVAYGSGFSDHAQFSRLFRKAYGVSPSDMLRLARA